MLLGQMGLNHFISKWKGYTIETLLRKKVLHNPHPLLLDRCGFFYEHSESHNRQAEGGIMTAWACCYLALCQAASAVVVPTHCLAYVSVLRQMNQYGFITWWLCRSVKGDSNRMLHVDLKNICFDGWGVNKWYIWLWTPSIPAVIARIAR